MLDSDKVRKDVVEPAYKALLLKVDAMIERAAAANAKHAHLSVAETRYFLARRLKHTKSPRLQACARSAARLQMTPRSLRDGYDG